MSSQADVPAERRADVVETTRPASPELEGGIPLPEELTGRASGTSEDLVTLFANEEPDHLADGFRAGSAGDPGSDLSPDQDAASGGSHDHLQPGPDE